MDYWLHFIDDFIELMNNFHVSLDVGYAVVRLVDPYKYFTSAAIERKKETLKAYSIFKYMSSLKM